MKKIHHQSKNKHDDKDQNTRLFLNIFPIIVFDHSITINTFYKGFDWNSRDVPLMKKIPTIGDCYGDPNWTSSEPPSP
jgi:hypothetical protein